MGKINFSLFILLALCQSVFAQMTILPDSLIFSGVVFDAESSGTLPDVTCRYGKGGTLSDSEGCFHILVRRGDTVRFSYVGFKMATVVIPDTLAGNEYLLGVFMTPDTLQLSEVLILRRWRESHRQNLINARNNMTGILKQAYTPVKEMDADMNQQMMINDYARSVEMRGHVDVKAGVGTQSLEAFRKLRLQKRMKEEKILLNPGEIDLLKKLYYLEKKEKQNK